MNQRSAFSRPFLSLIALCGVIVLTYPTQAAADMGCDACRRDHKGICASECKLGYFRSKGDDCLSECYQQKCATDCRCAACKTKKKKECIEKCEESENKNCKSVCQKQGCKSECGYAKELSR